MSNAVIQAEASASRRVWLQLAGSVTALGVVAALLPGPLTALGVAVGARRVAGTSALDVATLSAASLLVWALLGWLVLTIGVAALTRLPGRLGRAAGAVFGRIAPGILRRALIAGVGLSLLAGTTACGTDRSDRIDTGSAPAPAPAAAAIALPGAGTAARGVPFPRPAVHAPAAPGAAARGAADPGAATPGASDQIDLDWPVRRPGSGPATPSIDLDWPGAGAPDPSSRSAKPLAANKSDASSRAHPAAVRPTTVVVVQAGDTLWSLAADQLADRGGTPTDAQIDAAWRLWYAANRAVIGDDPNLILPGQQLLPPTAPTNGDAP